MISSCSAWIVATMSRIPSPRGALTAASRAASPSLATAGPAEDLVGEIDDLSPARVELAAAPHVLRAGGGGDVERARCGRSPVEQQRFVIVLLVEDADPADVGMLARKGVQPTETQPVVRDVQPLHLLGQRTDLGIPFDECRHLLDRAPQSRRVAVLHPRPLGVEPRVQPGHVDALGLQLVFVVLRCHTPPIVAVSGLGQRLCAMTGALPQAPMCVIRWSGKEIDFLPFLFVSVPQTRRSQGCDGSIQV